MYVLFYPFDFLVYLIILVKIRKVTIRGNIQGNKIESRTTKVKLKGFNVMNCSDDKYHTSSKFKIVDSSYIRALCSNIERKLLRHCLSRVGSFTIFSRDATSGLSKYSLTKIYIVFF